MSLDKFVQQWGQMFSFPMIRGEWLGRVRDAKMSISDARSYLNNFYYMSITNPTRGYWHSGVDTKDIKKAHEYQKEIGKFKLFLKSRVDNNSLSARKPFQSEEEWKSDQLIRADRIMLNFINELKAILKLKPKPINTDQTSIKFPEPTSRPTPIMIPKLSTIMLPKPLIDLSTNGIPRLLTQPQNIIIPFAPITPEFTLTPPSISPSSSTLSPLTTGPLTLSLSPPVSSLSLSAPPSYRGPIPLRVPPFQRVNSENLSKRLAQRRASLLEDEEDSDDDQKDQKDQKDGNQIINQPMIPPIAPQAPMFFPQSPIASVFSSPIQNINRNNKRGDSKTDFSTGFSVNDLLVQSGRLRKSIPNAINNVTNTGLQYIPIPQRYQQQQQQQQQPTEIDWTTAGGTTSHHRNELTHPQPSTFRFKSSLPFNNNNINNNNNNNRQQIPTQKQKYKGRKYTLKY